MPTRNVNLTEHFDRFIEKGITSGRFSNASEVVREALRLLEQREQENKAKLEWMRGAVKEATESIGRGEGIEFETMDERAAYAHRICEEASAELTAEQTKRTALRWPRFLVTRQP